MGYSRSFTGALTPGTNNRYEEIVSNFSSGNTLRLFAKTSSQGKGAGSIQYNILAVSNVANTFTVSTGTAATLVNQGITYTALVNALGSNATDGNNIAIEITIGPGVTVNVDANSKITITVFLGMSTVDQVVAALQASTAAMALISVSGSGATPVNPLAPTNLSGGVNSGFDTTTGVITTASVNGTHFPGQVGALTTTGGDFPVGFAALTNYSTYFANSTYQGPTTVYGSPTQFQLFSSNRDLMNARLKYNNAFAPPGTPGLIIPTTGGTLGNTITYTPTGTFVNTASILSGANDVMLSPNLPPASYDKNIVDYNPTTTNSSTYTVRPNLTFEGNATATLTTVGSQAISWRSAVGQYYGVTLPTATNQSYIIQVVGKA